MAQPGRVRRIGRLAGAAVGAWVAVACSSSSPTATQASQGIPSDSGTPTDSGAASDSGSPSDSRAGGAASGCSIDDAGTTRLAQFRDSPDGPDSSVYVDALAADATAVYAVRNIVDSGADGAPVVRTDVLRVPLDCSAASVLGSRPTAVFEAVWSVVLTADRVFVEMQDGIYSVPITGGEFTAEATTSALPGPMAVAEGELSWADTTGALWIVATGGGHTPREIATAAPSFDSGQGLWGGLAMDATNVYVAAEPGPPMLDDAGPGEGSIMAFPIAGGAGVTLATGQHAPGELMVGGGVLYWTNSYAIPAIDTANAHGPIMALALPAGSPEVLVEDETEPTQLILRGSTLCWIDYGGPDGGDGVRLLPAGGTAMSVPTPIVFGLEMLTLGPRGAYWVSDSSTELVGVSF